MNEWKTLHGIAKKGCWLYGRQLSDTAWVLVQVEDLSNGSLFASVRKADLSVLPGDYIEYVSANIRPFLNSLTLEERSMRLAQLCRRRFLDLWGNGSEEASQESAERLAEEARRWADANIPAEPAQYEMNPELRALMGVAS